MTTAKAADISLIFVILSFIVGCAGESVTGSARTVGMSRVENDTVAVYLANKNSFKKSTSMTADAEIYRLSGNNLIIQVMDRESGKTFKLLPVVYKNKSSGNYAKGFVFDHCLDNVLVSSKSDSSKTYGQATTEPKVQTTVVNPTKDYCNY